MSQKYPRLKVRRAIALDDLFDDGIKAAIPKLQRIVDKHPDAKIEMDGSWDTTWTVIAYEELETTEEYNERVTKAEIKAGKAAQKELDLFAHLRAKYEGKADE